MTTTFAATSGRRSAFRTVRSGLLGLMALFAFVFGTAVHAESVLEDISYTALPGGKVEVTLKFAGAAVAPQVFSTENPPSIALDFVEPAPPRRSPRSKRPAARAWWSTCSARPGTTRA